MTDDKDILQALYAACAQAWARLKKRWKGGRSSDKYIWRVRLTSVLTAPSARFFPMITRWRN